MNDGRMDVPEFDDPKWVMDLAFLVDITQEPNILNLKLQGPGQLITAAYESVKAFSTKLRNSAFCKKISVIPQHADLLWRRA